MKKKFRTITVNSIRYAWTCNYNTLTIWLDKKPIHTHTFNPEYAKDNEQYAEHTFTPKYVETVILKEL